MLGMSAALAAAVAQPANLQFVELFVSACMNGSAKFEKGAVRPVTQKELPPVLRSYRGWPDSRSYEVTKPSRGFLLMMRDDARKQRSAFYEVCTVAAPGLPFEAGFEQVMRVLQPQRRPRPVQGKALLEFYDPATRIVFEARTMPSGWGSLKLARATERYRLPTGSHPLMHIEQAPAEPPTTQPRK